MNGPEHRSARAFPTEDSADPEHLDDIAPKKEGRLQRLIADSPTRIPDVPEGPTAVAEEVRVPGFGRADVVVVDSKGGITIVECKRAVNPEMRRWVIGQLFSYAAGLWNLDFTDLERGFVRARRTTGLTKALKTAPGWEAGTLREAISDNLAAGTFRLIIAVDEITEELKRTVVYLNAHSPSGRSVLALELGLPGSKEVREVYGRSSTEIDFAPPPWPPDRWALLEKMRPKDAAVAEDLLDWAEAQEPVVETTYDDERALIKTSAGGLFRIFHREVRVSLSPLRRRWNDGRIRQLLGDLTKIDPAFAINAKRGGARPTAPLEALAENRKRKKFRDLMDENLVALTR